MKPPMTGDDYWRLILNNYTKDGDLPYGDKNRLKVLNKFMTAYGDRREKEARIDELKACLANVPMPILSYEQVQNRIIALMKGDEE